MKILKVSIIVIIVFLGSYVAGNFFSKNSEAFLTAKDFVSNSAIVKQELGKAVNISLSPFGYELEFAGASGLAEFESNVVGVNGKTGKVDIQLKKEFGHWEVIGASLFVDGRKVDLKRSIRGRSD